jgi:hypothetical protein
MVWRGHFLQMDKKAGAPAPFDVYVSMCLVLSLLYRKKVFVLYLSLSLDDYDVAMKK